VADEDIGGLGPGETRFGQPVTVAGQRRVVHLQDAPRSAKAERSLILSDQDWTKARSSLQGGAPSILLGTSQRAIEKAWQRLRAADAGQMSSSHHTFHEARARAAEAAPKETQIQSDLTRAKLWTENIEEAVNDMRPQIEVASWLRPILDGASGETVVIPAAYREGLEKAISKLPFADRGLDAVIGRDPEELVDLAGLRNLYAVNRAVFAQRMAPTLAAVKERDRALSEADQELNQLSQAERDLYPLQMDGLRVEASRQADQMPKQTRWPRSDETTDAILQGFIGAAAGLGIDPQLVILAGDAFIPDSPTDIEIYLFDPPVNFEQRA
jgi:hypothetical protein